MQTYSHLLLTALIRERIKLRSLVPSKAFLLGSVAPDLPLALLTLIYWAERRIEFGPGVALFGPGYDQLYFRDPLWIAGHNIFHAPLIAFSLAAFAYRRTFLHGAARWSRFFWFWSGCALHSLLDIFTHYDDGPLLLFPFDWTTRFYSVVSYWDPRHYAGLVAPIEHALDVFAVGCLIARSERVRKSWRRLGGPATLSPVAEEPDVDP